MKHLYAAFAFTIALALAVTGCDSVLNNPEMASDNAVTESQGQSDARGLTPGQTNMVKVTATHEDDEHLFELSTHEVPSGWTTFRFKNKAHVTHLIYMVKVPEAQEGLSREDYMNEVTFPFQEAWDPYFAGEIDVGEFFTNLIEAVPEWLSSVVPSGGVGLTAGGETSLTTLNLEEGTYFIECYVLDSDGNFHSPLGMLEKLVVKDEDSGAPEPRADLELTVSSGDGIEFDENVRPGMHTVSVTFEDNMVYGNGLGHDVHLIHLDAGTSVTEVNDWMDYLDAGGDGFYADDGALMSTHDDPGPQTFLGGVQDIFATPQTAYVHVNLKPGDYAWVAEVSDPQGSDMLKEFTVSLPGKAVGR